MTTLQNGSRVSIAVCFRESEKQKKEMKENLLFSLKSVKLPERRKKKEKEKGKEYTTFQYRGGV